MRVNGWEVEGKPTVTEGAWDECPYCHRDWRMPFTHRECVQAAYDAGQKSMKCHGCKNQSWSWFPVLCRNCVKKERDKGRAAGVAQELENIAMWIKEYGNINPDDAIDEIARVLRNRARALQGQPKGES